MYLVGCNLYIGLHSCFDFFDMNALQKGGRVAKQDERLSSKQSQTTEFLLATVHVTCASW